MVEPKWARLEDLNIGDQVAVDEGFDCMIPGRKTVKADDLGRLFVDCDEGRHFLDGQCDDEIHCVGITKIVATK